MVPRSEPLVLTVLPLGVELLAERLVEARCGWKAVSGPVAEWRSCSERATAAADAERDGPRWEPPPLSEELSAG